MYDARYEKVIPNLADNVSLYLSHSISIFQMEITELYMISFSDFL